MLKQRYSQRVVASKYGKYFACSLDTLRTTLSRHKNRHLGHPAAILVPFSQDGSNNHMSPVKLETLAQRLMDIAMVIASDSPEQVKIRDALAAQELLLKWQSVQAREDNFKTILARLFGGIGLNYTKEIVEEAELAD